MLPKGSLQIVKDNHIEKDYEGHFFTDNYHKNRVCWTYTGDGIRESQSQSATRLQREVIDCLRLHDAENKERFEEATAPGKRVLSDVLSAYPAFLLLGRQVVAELRCVVICAHASRINKRIFCRRRG